MNKAGLARGVGAGFPRYIKPRGVGGADRRGGGEEGCGSMKLVLIRAIAWRGSMRDQGRCCLPLQILLRHHVVFHDRPKGQSKS